MVFCVLLVIGVLIIEVMMYLWNRFCCGVIGGVIWGFYYWGKYWFVFDCGFVLMFVVLFGVYCCVE